MPVFTYQGRTAEGVTTGEVEAPDRTSAVGTLRQRRVLVTSIKEKAGATAWVDARLARKVKDREMAVFTRQFSAMIDAGLPLVQCLNVLAEQSDSGTLRAVTARAARDVESGSTLANALRKHPKVFDDLFTNMVDVGEAGGLLDVVLQRLSTYIEKVASLKRKIQSATIYPLTIIGVSGLVVIFMLTFVIPVFAKMFSSLGADLPLPTKIVVWLSDLVRGFALLIPVGLGAAAVAIRAYVKTEAGKTRTHALLLRLPVLGPLFRKVAVARVARTLGTLVSSGVPLLEGLRITARTAGNKVVEKAILTTRDSVMAGRTLAGPLKASEVFPPMVIQMVHVGEQTGALDAMLAKVADFYEDEVDTAVATLTSLMEPLMIIVLGVVIGGIVVAMYLPIFKMITLFK